MMYGTEREPALNQGSDAPRAISKHLAGLVAATPRASELDEAGPESNGPRGKGTAVESTLAYPGGPATVHESGSIAGHTDDDARLDAEGELVEPEVPGGDEPRKGAARKGKGGEAMTSGRVEQPGAGTPARKATPPAGKANPGS